MNRPGIGVGVFVRNGTKVLVHQRKNAHGQDTWGLIGGHMEFGKTFEETARDEVREETGLTDIEFKGIFCLNNEQVYGKHYVNIGFLTEWKSGEPFAAEPEKSRNWHWVDPQKLPQPMFPPSGAMVESWLAKRFTTEVRS